MQIKRVKVIADGRVQGVGFRYFVQRQANYHGVNGFVRNLPNGSVEIDAEADRIQLDAFISDCRKGPMHSRVDSFNISELPPFGYANFKIK